MANTDLSKIPPYKGEYEEATAAFLKALKPEVRAKYDAHVAKVGYAPAIFINERAQPTSELFKVYSYHNKKDVVYVTQYGVNWDLASYRHTMPTDASYKNNERLPVQEQHILDQVTQANRLPYVTMVFGRKTGVNKTREGHYFLVITKSDFNSPDVAAIIGHELGHIANGDLEEKKNILAHNNPKLLAAINQNDERMADAYAAQQCLGAALVAELKRDARSDKIWNYSDAVHDPSSVRIMGVLREMQKTFSTGTCAAGSKSDSVKLYTGTITTNAALLSHFTEANVTSPEAVAVRAQHTPAVGDGLKPSSTPKLLGLLQAMK